jgi:hypothetical protein
VLILSVNLNNKFNLPVKVHCWGGLGSQLFALALIYDLMQKWTKRRFILIQHTSGVSLRNSELTFIKMKNLEFREIDDFSVLTKKMDSQLSLNFSKLKLSIKKMLKNFIISLGFYSTANNYKESMNLKPWLVILRGHYSNRPVSKNFINYFLDHFIRDNLNKEFKPKTIALHYRLGDLITLYSKNPVSFDYILSKINDIIGKNGDYVLEVFSDSPLEARRRIETYSLNLKITYVSSTTIKVIQKCVYAEYFIGTNSKVSYWISLFRENLNLADKTFCTFETKSYKNDLLFKN